MTKFEPLAIGERGKDRANPTAAERRLLMEKFTRTGAHPELERDDEDLARRARVKKTTRSDAMRVKAFLDIEATTTACVIEIRASSAEWTMNCEWCSRRRGWRRGRRRWRRRET
jgi:hypothetical protein